MNPDADIEVPKQWIYMAVARRHRTVKKSPPTTRKRTVRRWLNGLKKRYRDDRGWTCQILAVKA